MTLLRSAYVVPDELPARCASWLRTLTGMRGRASLDPRLRLGLLVLDLQRLFCDPLSPAFLPAWPASAVCCQQLIRTFLAAGRPVAFTRHVHYSASVSSTFEHFFPRLLRSADPLSELMSEWIFRFPAARIFEKDQHSAWSNPGVATWFRHCDAVVLAGVQTQLCVAATAFGAAALNQVPIVVADACVAPNEAQHLAALSTLAAGHAYVAGTNEILALFAQGGAQ